MAYDFDLRTVAPIVQDLLTRRALEEQAVAGEPKPLLSLLSNPEQSAPAEQPPPQPQQSPQTQQQEPLDGKQMIDVSMAKALDIPQAPNPYALNVQRGLLAQKQAYADAQTDAGRSAAHSRAELLRNKANAAGIDISGYGSDVSLGDAVNNLASQEARDIMGALQGYYSGDSGQYYTDKYLQGIEMGMSPRRARKAAEVLAGNYKADRMQYLDGLLNSYGRADTALANQIIASMIPEAPALAQFYALTNPSPLNEYNTAVDVAKEAAKQGYALDLLGAGHGYDLEKIAAQTAGSIKLEDARSKNTLQRDKLGHQFDRENAHDTFVYNSRLKELQGDINEHLTKLSGAITRANQEDLKALEYEYGIKRADYDLALKRQSVAEWSALADWFGYKGDAKRDFMTAAIGIKTPDPNTGKFDKSSIESAKKVHDALDASEKNILEQIKNAGMDLDPKTEKELKSKLEQIRVSKQNLINYMGDQLDSGQMYSEFDEGNDGAAEQRNIASVAAILQIGAQAGASEKQQFDAVRKWVPSDRTDAYVQGLIRKANGG